MKNYNIKIKDVLDWMNRLADSHELKDTFTTRYGACGIIDAINAKKEYEVAFEDACNLYATSLEAYRRYIDCDSLEKRVYGAACTNALDRAVEVVKSARAETGRYVSVMFLTIQTNMIADCIEELMEKEDK